MNKIVDGKWKKPYLVGANSLLFNFSTHFHQFGNFGCWVLAFWAIFNNIFFPWFICGHTHHFVILYVISCQFSTQLIERSKHNRRMSCGRLFLRTKNILIASAASSKRIKNSLGREHSWPHRDVAMDFVSEIKYWTKSDQWSVPVRFVLILMHSTMCILHMQNEYRNSFDYF